MTQVELQEEFTRIYETNRWGGRVSRSGKGSDPEQTYELVTVLRDFIQRREIRSVVDLGCGDVLWMWDVVEGLSSYVGVDIVARLIEDNQAEVQYRGSGGASISFIQADVTRNLIPAVDAILCRDVICHLEYPDALRLIQNVKQSSSKWFVAGMYPKLGRVNPDTLFLPGRLRWYPPVLTKPPFDFPEPVEMLSEGEVKQFVPGYEDKSLGVWDISSL